MNHKEQFNKAAALMVLGQAIREPEGFEKEAMPGGQYVAKGLQGLGRGALKVLNKFMPKGEAYRSQSGAGLGWQQNVTKHKPHFDTTKFDEEMLGRIGGITAGGGGVLGLGGLLGYSGGHSRGHRAGGRKALDMAGEGIQNTYGGLGGRINSILGGANPGLRTLAEIGKTNFG